MSTKRKRVAVLMGGVSAEREISLASGAAVADALEARGHEVLRLDIGEDADRQLRLARQQFGMDAAFIALHGTFGEDGCIQGILECMGVPYTGSSVLSSALAMDKLKSKELFRLHNVPTPPYYVAHKDDLTDLEELHGSFGFPAMVKPRSEGSSIGISRATNLAELAVGVRRALDLGHDALIERAIKGAEVQVGILGGRVLGAIEVEPKSRPFYDFVAKYTPGATDYHLPPRLSPTRIRGVMNLAERAARSLGVSGACRVDMIVTEGENEYVLEVNTLPGMTTTSLLPKIAAGAGYDFATLCDSILDLATLHIARPRVAAQAANDARPAVTPAFAPATPAARPLRVAARTR